VFAAGGDHADGAPPAAPMPVPTATLLTCFSSV
jgi:hypothetical protein